MSDIPASWNPIGPVPNECGCPPGWWPGIPVIAICGNFVARGKIGGKARQCRSCGHNISCHAKIAAGPTGSAEA